MKKNRKIFIGIIVLLIAIIAGGACYYKTQKTSSPNNVSEEVTNYDTKKVNEYLNNDDIINMNLYVEIKGYKATEDKSKIEKVAKYLKNLKVEVTDEEPGISTPNTSISFEDKNGKKYRIDLYGNIADMYVNNESLGQFYKFDGYNYNELIKVCDEAGLEEN